MRINSLALYSLPAFLCGCIGSGPSGRVLAIQKQHDALSELCYQSAGEFIETKAINVNALYFSPRSNVVGDWGFELFYGVNEPKKWGEVIVHTSTPEIKSNRSPGAYEIRYTHIPIERKTRDKVLAFHGVRQEVLELSSGKVIAHRENYIWGSDFNRSTFCLGADWYSGNEAFLERVLGPRYAEHPRSLLPELYIKAKLLTAKESKVKLENYWYQQEKALPPGSKYDYNNRTITLPDGKFYMPSYRNNEPISYAATVIQAERYVFVMLPGGHSQNWPLRQLLLSYRDKQGNAIQNIYIQIPPVVDWSNGWGMRPSDVVVEEDQVEFSIYGKKIRTGEHSDQNNAGQYLYKYTFTASITKERLITQMPNQSLQRTAFGSR